MPSEQSGDRERPVVLMFYEAAHAFRRSTVGPHINVDKEEIG
jgi:hypothetical protein